MKEVNEVKKLKTEFAKGPIRRKMLAVVAVAIALLAVSAGCKKKAVDPLPPSGAVAGWEKSSDTRVFEAKDLWQYIDGDAEQYIQAGVVSTSTSDYKSQNQLDAVVDVYTMGDSAGARKILETGDSSGAKTVKWATRPRVEQSVIFRKGPYLVRIVAYEATPCTGTRRASSCWFGPWRTAWKQKAVMPGQYAIGPRREYAEWRIVR